jgi:hypothetical protein
VIEPHIVLEGHKVELTVFVVTWSEDVVVAGTDVAVVKAVAVEVSPSANVARTSMEYVFPA